MRRLTRPFAFAAGAAVAVAAAVTVAAPAPAQETTTIVKQTGFGAAGLITLDLKESQQVQYLGSPETTQASLSTGCPATIGNGTTDLLSVKALGTRNPRVGLDGEKIGVGANSDGGSACYTADLKVNGQAIELTFGGRLVGDMSLDIAFKGESGLSAAGFFDGSPVSVAVDGGPEDANDDGPDCAGCDHWRITLTPAQPIDRLVLEPKAKADGSTNTSTASIALSGGYTEEPVDFTRGELSYSGNGSVFEVMQTPEGTTTCGGTITDEDTGVVLTHLATDTVAAGEGLNVCTPQPYLIERGSDDAVLVALTSSPTDAYVVDIPFADPLNLVESDNGDYYLDPPTEVDYLLVDSNGESVEGSRRALTLCDGTYDPDASNPYVDLKMSVDVLPDIVGDQGACGITRTIRLSEGQVGEDSPGGDSVTVIETVLIVGDPRFYGN